jgi:hypothetical protein
MTAADPASVLKLMTSTTANDNAGIAALRADQLITQSLTDDALPFEEYLLPQDTRIFSRLGRAM